mmetsp:Transcript_12103/g.34817  ORF Transcript_12103/g.34817 Transcript_12103/m.34817 type:complete len:667 (+) Transcript_12103:27-2027(+)
MAALATLALSALTPRFAWEAARSSYHYEAVAGDPASCCGAQLVGDPVSGSQPYNCPSDATAGACDAGSCCDPDCSKGALATVDGVFECVTEETPFSRSNVLYCSDALPLSTVNLPASARADGWVATTEFNDLLCVYKDNSPSIGSFYSDPTTVGLTAQQVMNEIEAAAFSFFSTKLSGPRSLDTSSPMYHLGDPVLGEGCVSADDARGCGSLGPVLLPGVSPDGSCDTHGRSLPFLQDIQPYTCTPAEGASLVELCSSRLAAQQVTILNRGAAAALATAPNLGLQLAVSVLHRLEDGGDFVPSGAPIPQAIYDFADGGVCRNALVGLEWRFVVTDAGTISEATAYIDIRNISSPVSQRFGAKFELGSEAEVATTVRPVSGRPGYLRGLPLLVADGTPPSSGETATLKLRMEPTPVLERTAGGACDFGASDALSIPLTFGDEVAASCVESFNSVDELRQWCEQAPALSEIPVLRSLNLTWGGDALAWIGSFGDAHPDAAADWTPLRLATDNDAIIRSWDASRLQCDNVLSSVEVQILFVEIGALLVPAKKIAGARLKLSSRSVRAARCPLGQPTGQPCHTRYAITASTRFVQLTEGQSVEAYVPPLPRIFPAFPADVLYPFFRPSSAAESSRRMLHEAEPTSSLWTLVALPAFVLITAAAARRHKVE